MVKTENFSKIEIYGNSNHTVKVIIFYAETLIILIDL